MAERLEGIELPVDALIQIGVAPGSIAALQSSFQKFGQNAGAALAGGVQKGTGNVFDDISRAVADIPKRAARDQAWKQYVTQLVKVAKEAEAALAATGNAGAQANARAAAEVRQLIAQINSLAVASNQTRAATTAAVSAPIKAAQQSSAAVDGLVDDLQKVLAATKGNEAAWKDLATVIVASVNKAARELSKDIVGEQTQQQLRGIQKAAQQQAFQAQKDAARQALQQQRALDREQEQSRQASARSQLAAQKSALSQENAAYNASLQSNLVAEKGFQQRRTALVQAGLLATRSLYQSLSSGASSVISGAYSAMVSATRRGEDQITAANRQGLQQRRNQTEQITQQTVADIRRQQGAIAAATASINQGGVVGAVTGQSAAGSLLRGGLFGGAALGGAFGIRQLVNEASGFEANLRVFAVLNDELQQTPALMEQIRQTALDLGNDVALPGVSAADAAAAITALAKTGLDLQQSMDASRGSLLLARNAGIDFTESARTIGSTLNALGLDASDTTLIVDGLSAALKEAGGATFDELRQAQAQALLVFKQGFQFADDPVEIMNNLNTSLALFSRNALRGSDAGTSLKTFVSSLSGISEGQREGIGVLLKDIGESGTFLFDASGRARDFSESIDLVRRAFLNLDPAERGIKIREIFGSDAQRAAEIFVSTSKEELDSLGREIANSAGLTQRLAEAQNQGLRASVDSFVSTIETAFIKIFAFVDKPLGKIVSRIADGIGALVNDEALAGLRGALIGIAGALTAILAAKGGLEVLRLTGILLSSFASPLGVVVLALSAVGGAIGFVLSQSEPLREALARLFDRLKGGAADAAAGPLGKIAEVFQRVRERVERAAEVVGFFITLLIDSDIRKRFIEWQQLDPSVEKEGLLGFFLNLIDTVPKVVQAIIDGFKEALGFIKKVATDPSFETLRKAVVGAAAGVAALVVAIKGIDAAKAALTGLRTIATVATGFASPFGIAAIAIGALAAGFVILYQKSEPFRRLVDGLVEGVKDVARTILQAAMPALSAFAGVIKDSAGRALEGLQGVLESVVAFVGSAGFTNALTRVGEIVGGVIEHIAAGFQRVVDFITAVSRVISDLGVFEGLRGAVVVAFEGITGFISDIFSTIGSTIAGFFSGIDWAAVAATAAAGIFNFFRTIGRTVGRFIGSKEFLTTVAAALAALAATIASAAGGLVTGLIEGLRDSDAGQQIVDFFGELIGLGADEIEGAGDVLADAIRSATVDGLTLALSAAFPPELFRRLFTDPLGSALGAAVLLVEVLFIGKIVRMFVSGFQTVQRTIQGIALAPKVLQGGLASISDDLRNTGAAARNNAQDLSRVNQQYGTFAGRIVKVADTVNGFGKTQEQAAATTQTVSKNIDGQTAALLRNEAAARGNVSNIQATTAEERKRATVIETVKDNYLALAGAIAGGAVAGVGIGQALTADNPLGVISGITAAIGGIGTIAVTTAQVVATSGLTAGLLTGGVGLAVLAITAAVTFFTQRKNEIKAASDAAKAAEETYATAFKNIYAAAGGSGAKAELELLSRLTDDASGEFDKLRSLAEDTGTSLADVARAAVGSSSDANDFILGLGQKAGDAQLEVDRLSEKVLELRRNGFENTPRGNLAEAQLAEAEARLAALGDLQLEIQNVRTVYAGLKSDASAEAAIRREIKEIERERASTAQGLVDRQNEAKAALEAQIEALLTIADLEAGRSSGDEAARRVRQGLRGAVDVFLPTDNGDGTFTAPQASLSAAPGSAQLDAAQDALAGIRQNLGEVAAEWANASETQADYEATFAQVLEGYKQTLIEAGATPDLAQQIVDNIAAGLTGGNQVRDAFIASAEEGITALQTVLGEAEWTAEVVAELDEGPAKTALENFIAEPDAKDIEALFDLGVPKDALAEFIANPDDKTIQPILQALSGADAAALAAITAPATKRITVIADIAPIFGRLGNTVGGAAAAGINRIAGAVAARNNKYGSIITEPTLTWVGEEKRKEVIIPLTMPNRAAQLYEQSGLASVLAKAGVMAPGMSPNVQRVVAATGGPSRGEFQEVVSELRSLRSDLREDMDTRRDNVFLMEGVEKPYPTARETASKLRRKRRRR